MLPRAQIRSDKLSCFIILTLFDSLWVYKNKRFNKKKRLATKKTRAIRRKGRREKKAGELRFRGETELVRLAITIPCQTQTTKTGTGNLPNHQSRYQVGSFDSLLIYFKYRFTMQSRLHSLFMFLYLFLGLQVERPSL